MTVIYLAIDGGGTKTDVVLFDNKGNVISRVIGESTNPNALKNEDLHQRFYKIFSELFSKLNSNEKSPEAHSLDIKIKAGFAGMAGADHPKLNQQLKNAILENLPVPCDELEVANDAITALWSGTDGGPGLVVIAGTGAIAYGVKADGETFRIGGWGHLISDEGSGYFVGKEAVRAAFRAEDGLGPKTDLTKRLLSAFNVQKLQDLIPIIYQEPKKTMAGLAPIVIEAADFGDAVAQQIVKNAVQALLELMQAGQKTFDQPEVNVVLAGGLWKSKGVQKELKRSLQFNATMPTVPPVYGAVVGVLKKEGGNVEVLKKIKAYLAEA